MAANFISNNTKKIVGSLLCLMFLWAQFGHAQQAWQLVVLADSRVGNSHELPASVNVHEAITQTLTTALTNANFAVLTADYASLPDCHIEDCSALSRTRLIERLQAANKPVDMALLYQVSAFKQHQSTAPRWYFSVAGRLLDLQSGIQQDAFSLDDWVTPPATSCVGDCFTQWATDRLTLLAQDLGAVMSEKLSALPRQNRYQLNLHNFNGPELVQFDRFIKNTQGYVADQLLADQLLFESPLDSPKPETEVEVDADIDPDSAAQNHRVRSYELISQLSASALATEFSKLKSTSVLTIAIEYTHTHRQFDIVMLEENDSWTSVRQFFSGLLPNKSTDSDDPTNAKLPNPNPSLPISADAQTADPDSLLWQQALSVNTLEGYQQYLSVWPKGRYFIKATAAIKQFQLDAKDWQHALALNTNEAFQQYLVLHPAGQNSTQAKQRLTQLLAQQTHLQKQHELRALAEDYYFQQQNVPEAIHYYQQAAILGDTLSQFKLAKIYEQGEGVTKDMRQASIWYTQAAAQGHIEAQATLGFIYSKGQGVKQDYAQAAHWYQQAAKQGHRLAQHNLAYLYELGQGVTKNLQQAAHWYKKAANQGDADAQNSLGKLYERGLGVEKDIIKAKHFYQQSAAQGNQIAQLNLQMLVNPTTR